MRRNKCSMRFVGDRLGVESGGEAACSMFARLGGECTLTLGTERLVEHGPEAWMAELAGSRKCVEVPDMVTMAEGSR